MRTLFAVSIIILFFSCSRKKKLPEGILEPQKMQSVFWDYIRADVYTKDIMKKDSTKNDTTENIKLQNKLFSFYNISRTDFYKSYDYYVSHPDLMNVLMDTILAKQNRLKSKNQFKINKIGLESAEKHSITPVNKDGATFGDRNKMKTPNNRSIPVPFDKIKTTPLNNGKKIIPEQKTLRVD